MTIIRRGASLSISGPPEPNWANIMTLFIGPFEDDNQMELFIPGPAGGEMPLFIGPNYALEITDSGDIPLYMNAIPSAGTPDSEAIPLSIYSDQKLSQSGAMTLLLDGPEVTPSQLISNDSETTLYITNYTKYEDPGNASVDLNIKTDFNIGDTFTFYIKSTNPSDTMPLYASGIGGLSNNLTLRVSPPPFTGDTTLYNIGYSE